MALLSHLFSYLCTEEEEENEELEEEVVSNEFCCRMKVN